MKRFIGQKNQVKGNNNNFGIMVTRLEKKQLNGWVQTLWIHHTRFM